MTFGLQNWKRISGTFLRLLWQKIQRSLKRGWKQGFSFKVKHSVTRAHLRSPWGKSTDSKDKRNGPQQLVIVIHTSDCSFSFSTSFQKSIDAVGRKEVTKCRSSLQAHSWLLCHFYNTSIRISEPIFLKLWQHSGSKLTKHFIHPGLCKHMCTKT